MDTLLKLMTDRGDAPRNLNDSERWLSVIAGGMVVLAGISRRSPRGILLAAAGTTLIRRGLSGRCPVYGALDLNTLTEGESHGGRAPSKWTDDLIDEAGEDSFPASDPPAWPSDRHDRPSPPGA